jgi:hypothetical protein
VKFARSTIEQILENLKLLEVPSDPSPVSDTPLKLEEICAKHKITADDYNKCSAFLQGELSNPKTNPDHIKTKYALDIKTMIQYTSFVKT